MIKSRLDLLKKHIHKLEIDVERGVILNRNITILTEKHTSVKLANTNYGYHEIIAVAGGLDILNLTVDHINFQKWDNRIVNLEAVSRGENTARAHQNGLIPYRGLNVKLNVSKIKSEYASGKYTMRTLGDKYGVSRTTILNAIHS